MEKVTLWMVCIAGLAAGALVASWCAQILPVTP